MEKIIRSSNDKITRKPNIKQGKDVGGRPIRTGKLGHPDTYHDIMYSLATGERGVDIAKRYDTTKQAISKININERESIAAIRKRNQDRLTEVCLDKAMKIAEKELDIDDDITGQIAEKVASRSKVTKDMIDVKNVVTGTKTEVLRKDDVFSKTIGKQINNNQYNNQNSTKIDIKVLDALSSAFQIKPMEMNKIEESHDNNNEDM